MPASTRLTDSFLHGGWWVQRFDISPTSTGHQATPGIRGPLQWFLSCTPALPFIVTSDQVNGCVDHLGFLPHPQGSVLISELSCLVYVQLYKTRKAQRLCLERSLVAVTVLSFQKCPTVGPRWTPIKAQMSPGPLPLPTERPRPHTEPKYSHLCTGHPLPTRVSVWVRCHPLCQAAGEHLVMSILRK